MLVGILAVGLAGCGGAKQATVPRPIPAKSATTTTGPITTTTNKATTTTGKVATTTTPPPTWVGFGSPLAVFAKRYPKNLFGCPAGTCYGAATPDNPGSKDQFTVLTTANAGWVAGYTQAISNGTPKDVAEHMVLSLFPPDTTITSQRKASDNFGECYLMDVASTTLAQTLGDGDRGGAAGIELLTVKKDGSSDTFDESNVNEAIVDLVPSAPDAGC